MSDMKFDISDFVPTLTEQSVKESVAKRFVMRRKELKLTQKQVASRSGVSYATVRRFEQSGDVSFASMLALARVIDCLADFEELFSRQKITNLRDYRK